MGEGIQDKKPQTTLRTTEMTDANDTLPVSTLNINRRNIPIERQKLSDQVIKPYPNMLFIRTLKDMIDLIQRNGKRSIMQTTTVTYLK